MSPDPAVLALVLLAAVLHAVWNALIKASGDAWLTSFVLVTTGSVLCAVALPFAAPPVRASWPYLLAGVALHNFYLFFLLQSYRVGDLSQVYPVARGSGPLFVAAASGVVAGESLSATETLSVLLICAGLLSLAFERGRAGAGGRRPVLFALATGLFIASYTLVDGLGIRRAGSRLGFILWLQALEALPFAAVTLVLRRGEIARFARTRGRPGMVAGVLALVAYSLVLWAYSLGAIAPIAALRETSVIFAAAIGAIFLGEPFGRRRLLAACLVAAGIVALNLPGRGG